MNIFITAGEASGDQLGAAIMAGLADLSPGVEFRGVGGPLMASQGLVSLFDMDELSVMGLAEILPKYSHLKRRIRETAEAALDWEPDAVLTIDSPDFSFRIQRLIRDKSTVHTAHYVAPSVWAWRPRRAEKISHFVDQVLAILPFEPPYFTKYGMRCDFVGHPIATQPKATQKQKIDFVAKYGLDRDRPSLVLLPGSRSGEISRLLPNFLNSLDRAQLPDYQIVLPTLIKRKNQVQSIVAQSAQNILIVCDDNLGAEDARVERQIAMEIGDLALAASGTVSLELAHAGTPMIIAYDMNFLSRAIISRLLKTDTVTLANLITNTREIPEFIGKNCQPEKIAEALEQLSVAPQSQRAVLKETMVLLGQGQEAPGKRAAKALIDAIS